jgi:hypothetical protein
LHLNKKSSISNNKNNTTLNGRIIATGVALISFSHGQPNIEIDIKVTRIKRAKSKNKSIQISLRISSGTRTKIELQILSAHQTGAGFTGICIEKNTASI